MSVFQTALSSARFNRLLMWGSGIILFVGVAVLLMTLVKGNDTTQVNPDKGFHPQLPAKSTPLQNSKGVTITKYKRAGPRGALDHQDVPQRPRSHGGISTSRGQ